MAADQAGKAAFLTARVAKQLGVSRYALAGHGPRQTQEKWLWGKGAALQKRPDAGTVVLYGRVRLLAARQKISLTEAVLPPNFVRRDRSDPSSYKGLPVGR